jgi:hypothetical protein
MPLNVTGGKSIMSSKFTNCFRCIDAVAVIGLLMLTVTVGQAVELNPAAVIYKLPDQIEWKGTGGNRNAVLVGDPEKPGLYIGDQQMARR